MAEASGDDGKPKLGQGEAEGLNVVCGLPEAETEKVITREQKATQNTASLQRAHPKSGRAADAAGGRRSASIRGQRRNRGRIDRLGLGGFT